MTKDEAIEKMKEKGADDALNLRGRASTMDGTAIIAEESKVPDFDATKDYSACPVGTPVADEGQVWKLIQPYNAANYSGRPSTLRALWGLFLTTDRAKARRTSALGAPAEGLKSIIIKIKLLDYAKLFQTKYKCTHFPD